MIRTHSYLKYSRQFLMSVFCSTILTLDYFIISHYAGWIITTRVYLLWKMSCLKFYRSVLFFIQHQLIYIYCQIRWIVQALSSTIILFIGFISETRITREIINGFGKTTNLLNAEDFVRVIHVLLLICSNLFDFHL